MMRDIITEQASCGHFAAPATIAAMPISRPFFASVTLLAAVLLGACSPTFDWRDVRMENSAVSVLMPAKPSVATRPVTLKGRQYQMTMSAAEVQHVMFAVGTLKVTDPGMAGATMTAMKDALLNNIGATAGTETVTRAEDGRILELNAIGRPDAAGQVRSLHARFVARDTLIVQALVAGPQKTLTPELVETFMTSLKVN